MAPKNITLPRTIMRAQNTFPKGVTGIAAIPDVEKPAMPVYSASLYVTMDVPSALCSAK
jgi:hypothetical protein